MRGRSVHGSYVRPNSGLFLSFIFLIRAGAQRILEKNQQLYMPGRLKWSFPIYNKIQIYLKIIEEPNFGYRTHYLTNQWTV